MPYYLRMPKQPRPNQDALDKQIEDQVSCAKPTDVVASKGKHGQAQAQAQGSQGGQAQAQAQAQGSKGQAQAQAQATGGHKGPKKPPKK